MNHTSSDRIKERSQARHGVHDEDNVAGLNLTDDDVPLKPLSSGVEHDHDEESHDMAEPTVTDRTVPEVQWSRERKGTQTSSQPVGDPAIPLGFGDFSGIEIHQRFTPTYSTASETSTPHSRRALIQSPDQAESVSSSFPGLSEPIHKVSSGQATYVHAEQDLVQTPSSSGRVQSSKERLVKEELKLHNERNSHGAESWSAEPHSKLRNAGHSHTKLYAARTDTDQDWEITFETNSVQTAPVTLPTQSVERDDNHVTTDADVVSPWSHLRSFKAVVDLPSLERKSLSLPEPKFQPESSKTVKSSRTKQSIGTVHLPDTSITNLPRDSQQAATRIIPSSQRKLLDLFHSKQTNIFPDFPESPPLQSSSLFPQDLSGLSNSSGSSSGRFYIKQKPKMDKGKGQARDLSLGH